MDEEKQKKSIVIDSTNIFGLKKSKSTILEKSKEPKESSSNLFNFANPVASTQEKIPVTEMPTPNTQYVESSPLTLESSMAVYPMEPEVANSVSSINFEESADLILNTPPVEMVSMDLGFSAEEQATYNMQAGPMDNQSFFELPADPVSSAAFNFSVDQINSSGLEPVTPASSAAIAPPAAIPEPINQIPAPPPPSPSPSFSPVAPFDTSVVPMDAYHEVNALAAMSIGHLQSIRAELEMELSELHSLKSFVLMSFENSEQRLNQLLNSIQQQDTNLNNIQQGRMN
ncbi:MAG: hypothetical protein ACK5LM_06500 [Lactovum sp.]